MTTPRWLLICCIALATLAAEASPTTQPMPPLIGQMRPATLAAINMLCVTVRCTIGEMNGDAAEAINKVQSAAAQADLRPDSGIVIRYPDGIDMNGGRFEMQVGYAVAKDVDAPAGTAIVKLPPFKCATCNYSGPMRHMKDAYDALFDAVHNAGLKPIADFRENYFYWEGTDSDNDVTQLQVGIE